MPRRKKWKWKEPCFIFLMKIEIHVFFFLLFVLLPFFRKKNSLAENEVIKLPGARAHARVSVRRLCTQSRWLLLQRIDGMIARKTQYFLDFRIVVRCVALSSYTLSSIDLTAWLCCEWCVCDGSNRNNTEEWRRYLIQLNHH